MSDLPLPTKAAETLREYAPIYAKSKAQRIYLEGFLKVKKALLMTKSSEKTSAAKEMDAYASPDYNLILEGLREAVQIEENAKWTMTAAEAEIEIWRTESANNRQIDRSHR